MADATIKQVSDYFKKDGDTIGSFAAEWRALDDKSKADLKRGIGDGTLNY